MKQPLPLKPPERGQLWKALQRSTIFAVAGDGAAFAGGEVFRLLETEATEVAERAAFAVFVLGEPGLAGILDDLEPALARGQRSDPCRRQAVDVDWHDRAGAIGDAARDRGGVERERGGIGVGEDRQGFVGEDGVVGRDEGERGDDDLVAGVDVEHMQADDEGGGAAGGGEAAFGTDELRVAGLEIGHVRTGHAIPFAAAVHLEHLGFPLGAPDGPLLPAAGVHGCAAEQGGFVGGRGGNDGRRGGGGEGGGDPGQAGGKTGAGEGRGGEELTAGCIHGVDIKRGG